MPAWKTLQHTRTSTQPLKYIIVSTHGPSHFESATATFVISNIQSESVFTPENNTSLHRV